MVKWKKGLLLLEHDDGIGNQITEVQAFAFLHHIGMFLAQQPANMGEEEATSGIMRIGISFRELVVDTMIAGPMEGGILEGDRIENDQNETQRPFGFVGTMGPQTMSSSCDAQHPNGVQQNR